MLVSYYRELSKYLACYQVSMDVYPVSFFISKLMLMFDHLKEDVDIKAGLAWIYNWLH